MQGGGHEHVLGDGVAALGQRDVADAGVTLAHVGLVVALGGVHVEPEGLERLQVRGDGARAEVAAPGVGELELGQEVQQGAEEHDHRAGAARGLDVHARQVEHVGADELQLGLVVRPGHLDPDGLQHLEDPVDLLDLGHALQHRAAAVEQRGAQQGDGGVLGGAHVDGAGQLGGTLDPQVHRAHRRRERRVLQGRGDPRDVLEVELAGAGLDRAQVGRVQVERRGHLLGGEASLHARVTDQPTDARGVVLGHADRV